MNSPDALTPAQIAKAALRRLALAKQEPTPENYAQAWAAEAGDGHAAQPVLPPRARTVMDKLAARAADDPALRAELAKVLGQGQWDEAQRLLDRGAESAMAQSQAWAQVIERLARALERGGRQWTLARKKDSLQRVLDSSRGDMQRLLHRLKQLLASWDSDDAVAEAPPETPAQAVSAPVPGDTSRPGPGVRPAAGHWPDLVAPLEATVRAALPQDAPRAAALADELQVLASRIANEGASPETAAAVAEVCERARRLLSHRHHLLEQVHRLSREMAGGLAELSEDDTWVRGQVSSLREHLDDVLSARAVQAASELLAQTRARQRELRDGRDQARLALKEMIHNMLGELGELDQHTGRFSEGMLRYADTIERADTLEALAGMVREMVAESRDVHALVSSTRERLQGEHHRATALEAQVRALEADLRRLSDEVATDALTQVANRRGLMQHFETEQARLDRDGGELAVGLLDIDNFKRLNDTLGHAAGDQALVALAEHVRQSLRPVDAVARFGGEEFVVLLPGTPVDEAQRVLTRLQRQLSAGLFMHEGKDVLVTFSAGVTAYRPSVLAGPPLPAARPPGLRRRPRPDLPPGRRHRLARGAPPAITPPVAAPCARVRAGVHRPHACRVPPSPHSGGEGRVRAGGYAACGCGVPLGPRSGRMRVWPRSWVGPTTRWRCCAGGRAAEGSGASCAGRRSSWRSCCSPATRVRRWAGSRRPTRRSRSSWRAGTAATADASRLTPGRPTRTPGQATARGVPLTTEARSWTARRAGRGTAPTGCGDCLVLAGH